MELETSNRNNTWEGEGRLIHFCTYIIASCSQIERREREAGREGKEGEGGRGVGGEGCILQGGE